MVREMPGTRPRATDERLRELEATLESLREDSEVAHVLLGVSGALAEVRTIEETLERSVRITRELFSADRCFVAEIDPTIGRFFIRAHSGYDDATGRMIRKDRGPHDFPLLTEALQTRNPVLVDDVSSDPRTTSTTATPERGATIGVPLALWGERYGALQLIYVDTHRFGDKDAGLARGIGRTVSAALVNARRFNLLRSLSAFGIKLGTRPRLSDVVDQVVESAARLLSARATTLYFVDQNSERLVAATSHGDLPPMASRVASLDLTEEPWRALLDRAPAGERNEGMSFVVVPLWKADGSLLGGIAVYFERSSPLGPDELEALGVLGGQSAMAIENAQRFERQRKVASALQKGLLASEVPEIPGAEVGAIYEPASGEEDIGGDFFDVFDLPDGRFAIVIGDVSGKGAEAASQTAIAKYMLRAFALRNAAPSSVLFHLNKALTKALAEDRFTTLLYAVFDPATGEIGFAAAGHPPPLVYRKRTGTVATAEVEGPILGMFDERNYTSQSVTLSPGDVLVGFTDGLIEARNENDLYGRERVRASLAEYGGHDDIDGIARSLYARAKEFGDVTDDAVVLALRVKDDR